MYQALGERARQIYGFAADAVVNATYRVVPDGDVFSEGIAVEFIETAAPATEASAPPPSIEVRMRSLKALRDQGLIDEQEFLKKKAQLLDEL
jgi:hypothetical protein